MTESESSLNVATKTQWRDRIIAARERRSRTDKNRDDLALRAHIATPASSPLRDADANATVAAYFPHGTEPGSLEILDTLAARYAQVLLPVVADGPAAAVDWARYEGPESLQRGRFQIPEPSGPRLGHAAITNAAVILVPALAVDRRGVRLGRGAGFYDRTLTHTNPAVMVAVVYDDELVEALPADAHDIPVGWALTPHAGFTPLAPT